MACSHFLDQNSVYDASVFPMLQICNGFEFFLKIFEQIYLYFLINTHHSHRLSRFTHMVGPVNPFSVNKVIETLYLYYERM